MDTILVVEDDPSISRGLELNLQVEGYSVITASDGEDGLKQALDKRPDLMLLDVMLPKISGFDVCRQIRKQGLTFPIIMLTAKVQEIDKIMGLELGADDYVTKPFSVAEVVARVNAAMRRTRQFETSDADYAFGDYTLDVKGQIIRENDQEIELSQKEFLMLKLFLENEGKVLSRQEILSKVWGFDYYGTDRTVDNFINKLRQKIEPNPNKPRHIQTLRGAGYKFLR